MKGKGKGKEGERREDAFSKASLQVWGSLVHMALLQRN